jgi:hypothetical protein
MNFLKYNSRFIDRIVLIPMSIENSLKRKRSDDLTPPGTPESDYLSVHMDSTAALVEDTNNP